MAVQIRLQPMLENGFEVTVIITAANADELDAELVNAQAQIEQLRAHEVIGNRIADRRAQALNALSPREREVAELIAEGRANKQIAQSLGISVNTLESHLKHIYQKLGAHSRVELANKLRGKR